MMLGAGQILTPVKDTITLGDDHTQLPCWAVAGPLPHLGKLYSDLVEHNSVINGLRTDLNGASDPKTVMDATGQAVVENTWSTQHLAQVQTVNGLAQAQQWINQQQVDEKYRQDDAAFLAAVPH